MTKINEKSNKLTESILTILGIDKSEINSTNLKKINYLLHVSLAEQDKKTRHLIYDNIINSQNDIGLENSQTDLILNIIMNSHAS